MERRPIVLINGRLQQLPAGDTVAGAGAAGAEPVRLVAPFPAGATSVTTLEIDFPEQAGTYAVEINSGVANMSVKKNGVAVAVPFTVAVPDVVEVTGTTQAGARGSLIFRKQ